MKSDVWWLHISQALCKSAHTAVKRLHATRHDNGWGIQTEIIHGTARSAGHRRNPPFLLLLPASPLYPWGFLSTGRPPGGTWSRMCSARHAGGCVTTTRRKPFGGFLRAPQQQRSYSCLAVPWSYPWRSVHCQDTHCCFLLPLTRVNQAHCLKYVSVRGK